MIRGGSSVVGLEMSADSWSEAYRLLGCSRPDTTIQDRTFPSIDISGTTSRRTDMNRRCLSSCPDTRPQTPTPPLDPPVILRRNNIQMHATTLYTVSPGHKRGLVTPSKHQTANNHHKRRYAVILARSKHDKQVTMYWFGRGIGRIVRERSMFSTSNHFANSNLSIRWAQLGRGRVV